MKPRVYNLPKGGSNTYSLKYSLTATITLTN